MSAPEPGQSERRNDARKKVLLMIKKLLIIVNLFGGPE